MDFHKILSRLTALEGASSKKLNESIEIHADGAEAMALLGHADAGISSPDPIAPVDDFGMGDDDGIGALDAPMDEPEMGPPDLTSAVPGDEGSGADISDLQRLSGIEPEVAEEAVYANTPDEDIMPLAAAIPSGNDMHKEKGSWLKASGGDNPRGVVASLESKLMKSLKDYLKESEDESRIDELKGIRNNPKANSEYRKNASKSADDLTNRNTFQPKKGLFGKKGDLYKAHQKTDSKSGREAIEKEIDASHKKAHQRTGYINKAWDRS